MLRLGTLSSLLCYIEEFFLVLKFLTRTTFLRDLTPLPALCYTQGMSNEFFKDPKQPDGSYVLDGPEKNPFKTLHSDPRELIRELAEAVGGCLITPPCGSCPWCRAEAWMAAPASEPVAHTGYDETGECAKDCPACAAPKPASGPVGDQCRPELAIVQAVRFACDAGARIGTLERQRDAELAALRDELDKAKSLIGTLAKPDFTVARQAMEIAAERDRLAAELAEARACVEAWLCESCSTVFPGPPQPGLRCVICPKCGRDTGPLCGVRRRRAEQERDAAQAALAQATEALRQIADFGHAHGCEAAEYAPVYECCCYFVDQWSIASQALRCIARGPQPGEMDTDNPGDCPQCPDSHALIAALDTEAGDGD